MKTFYLKFPTDTQSDKYGPKLRLLWLVKHGEQNFYTFQA